MQSYENVLRNLSCDAIVKHVWTYAIVW